MDMVITVCSNARNETCPLWPGAPVRAHWSVEDPAELTEPQEAVEHDFARAYERWYAQANSFLELNYQAMRKPELEQALIIHATDHE